MAAANAIKTTVCNLIKSRILMSGPIPVADYMRMALTQNVTNIKEVDNGNDLNKVGGGYYMKKDVFGQQGDFITSPEISQMFGELLGVWGLETQQLVGGPKKFNIVELGPGRGTLSKDILRVFKKFEHLTGNEVSLHLVEISPFLASVQNATLCSSVNNSIGNFRRNAKEFSPKGQPPFIDPFKEVSDGKLYYHEGIAADTGFPVYWYRDIKDIPREFNFYVAHEFFDALPVHKLQRVENGWREVLVDVIQTKPETEVSGFRYVISRHETPAIKVLRSHYEKVLEDNRQHLEVSLDGLGILGELTNRLNADGGIAMIIDYGHKGIKEDTFRGFFQHKLHDPLVDPGTADLTADVDFSIIDKLFNDNAMICGPVHQRDFLHRVGIDYRLQMLMKNCQDEHEKENLISGYKMITEDMGSRFLCMSLFPKILQNYQSSLKIAGFHPEDLL